MNLTMDLNPNGRPAYQNIDETPWEMSQRMISLEQQQPDDAPTNENAESSNGQKKESMDYVLVYMENNNRANAQRREAFEGQLRDQGLILEYEENRQLCFVKIHAPREVLCRYCEILKLRMPIKQLANENTIVGDTTDIFEDAKSWLVRLFRFAQLDPVKFPPKEYRLAAEFSRDKDYLFDIEDENFTSNVRTMVVNFILERQSEGIQRLIMDRVYSAAYPLHDGGYKERGCIRSLLYEEWGATSKWVKLQPLDMIKEYFGVNFAMYFAWLGFYTFMLIPASIAGLLCFFYGLITLGSNTLVQDTCSSDVIMCPQCDRTCDYWRLNDTCLLARVTHLFDNRATVVFAVFMSFWATLYLELWKRKSAELSHRWGLAQWDCSSEHPRPQYLAALAKTKLFKVQKKVNAVTGEREPHVSYWKVRVPARLFSFSVVGLVAGAALAAVFAVVLYRMSLLASSSLFGQEVSSTYKTLAIPAIAATLNLVCILVLNFIYDWMAVYLTEMELMRTQAEFDDSLTIKVYLFQFVNYYASIFYVALLKGKFVGYPKKYNKILGYRQEECSPGGCLTELCIQLAIIMVGKQTFATAMEMVWPVLFKWWALFRTHLGLKQKDPIAPRNQWIKDFKLLDWGTRGLYDEYLEMVIQFGFVTLFVVAFPLAPLFALANNVLEMRLDATKFLRHYRRPVPRRTRDIGVWAPILDVVARISVITNALIIAFSSNLIPQLVYMMVVTKNNTVEGFLDHSLAKFNTQDFKNGTGPLDTSFNNITICRYAEYRNPPDDPFPYKRPIIYWHILVARLAFVVVFQNCVGLVTIFVQWSLSGVPRKLLDRIKREAFLVEDLIIKREAARAREQLPPHYESSAMDTDDQAVRRRGGHRGDDADV